MQLGVQDLSLKMDIVNVAAEVLVTYFELHATRVKDRH